MSSFNAIHRTDPEISTVLLFSTATFRVVAWPLNKRKNGPAHRTKCQPFQPNNNLNRFTAGITLELTWISSKRLSRRENNPFFTTAPNGHFFAKWHMLSKITYLNNNTMKQHVTTAVTRHQHMLPFPVHSGSIPPAGLDEIFHQGSAGALFFGQKHVRKK